MRKTKARGRRSHAALLCVLIGSSLLLACSGGESNEADGTAGTAPTAGAASEAPHAVAKRDDASDASADSIQVAAGGVVTKSKKAEKAARHSNERPVPNFEGRTLAGTSLSMQSMLGDRVVLFFFDPSDPKSPAVGRAVQALHEKGAENNFRVVGIGRGNSSAVIASFSRDNGLGFPVIDDSSGAIGEALVSR